MFLNTSHGFYLVEILRQTEELVREFYDLKNQKRSDSFDMANYFRLLDAL